LKRSKYITHYLEGNRKKEKITQKDVNEKDGGKGNDILAGKEGRGSQRKRPLSRLSDEDESKR